MRRERARAGRIVGALCLGHLAAALSFAVFTMVVMVAVDPSVPVTEPRRLAVEFAGIALALPLMALVAMLPFSAVTAPFTLLAAFRFRAGAGTALTIGALIGAAWVVGIELASGDWPGTWSRAGNPGDPRSLALIVVDGAVAGMAYAWVVWSRCIRPFRGKQGAATAPTLQAEAGR